MENYTKIVKDALKDNKNFIGCNNYNVIKVKKNYCELEGIITQSSLNNLNAAHGGYIFGLADTAAGIASMTNGSTVVTVDSTISYFKPAKGERIIASASAIKVGKTISVFDVLINDENGDLIAKATITFYNIDSKKNN